MNLDSNPFKPPIVEAAPAKPVKRRRPHGQRVAIWFFASVILYFIGSFHTAVAPGRAGNPIEAAPAGLLAQLWRNIGGVFIPAAVVCLLVVVALIIFADYDKRHGPPAPPE